VQQASNEVIKTVTASAPKYEAPVTPLAPKKDTTDQQVGAQGSSTGGEPSTTSATPDDSKTAKTDTKEVASNDKSGTKNEPAKKMYCN